MTRLAVLVLLLPALVACGGDDDEPDASTGTEVRDAVQAYSDAFLAGDGGTAYDLLSARCRDRTDEDAFAQLVDQAGEQYGSALDFTSYDEEVSGDLARVTYTYDVSEISQTDEPWVRESGEWRNDDC